MAKRETKSVTVTARVSSSLAKRLDIYAKAANRTRSWVVEDLLSRHIDAEIAFAEAILEGRRELDAGLGVPHEEAWRQVRAHITHSKRQRRKAA